MKRALLIAGPSLAFIVALVAIWLLAGDQSKGKSIPKKSVVTATQVEQALKASVLRNNVDVRVTVVDCLEQERNFFRCVVAYQDVKTNRGGYSSVLVRYDENGVGTVQSIAPPTTGPAPRA